jgi:hypothetical protein
MRAISLLILIAGCGSGLGGAWKTSDGKFSLRFADDGAYHQWDTSYPAPSLTQLNPTGNPEGAKIFGSYTVTKGLLVITGHDGAYPEGTGVGDVSLTSTYSIDGDQLTAPGLLNGVSTYLRASSAP